MKRQTRYLRFSMTEKQAEAADRALREIQQHFEECNEHVPVWKREAIFRVRSEILGALEISRARWGE